MQKIKKFFKFFSLYEYIWFFSLIIATILLAVFLPEEDTVGKPLLFSCNLIALVSGILCELLISKQNKYNFLVSLFFVETVEIVICFILKYYASAIITLVFWIPIDIISFINWNKHKDEELNDITKVRKLSLKNEIIVLIGAFIFAGIVGYLLKLVGGEDTYLDALASAFGICNGVFILLRYKEQWICWYIYAILEGVLWILSGQWIMLILTLGYLTNTTYGYIKWSKYIKNSKKEDKSFL